MLAHRDIVSPNKAVRFLFGRAIGNNVLGQMYTMIYYFPTGDNIFKGTFCWLRSTACLVKIWVAGFRISVESYRVSRKTLATYVFAISRLPGHLELKFRGAHSILSSKLSLF